MTANEAYARVERQLPPGLAGRFYSTGTSVGLGKGKIYDSVRCPVFNPENRTYVTAETIAYVLTHECDVETDNDRVFNDELLICPILDLGTLVEVYTELLPGDRLPAFLSNLGERNISRLVFLPAYPGKLQHGGVLYMNHVTHTHRSSFDTGNATELCAVTAYGLEHIENALENHLLRPKADRLAFALQEAA